MSPYISRTLPSNTPPEWNEISQWKRISVFGHQAYPGYTHLSRNLFQNERGRRSSANLNELTKSSAESMIRCPRGKKCYNRRARIMVKQPAHGQGDFDNWALDDLKVPFTGPARGNTELVHRKVHWKKILARLMSCDLPIFCVNRPDLQVKHIR